MNFFEEKRIFYELFTNNPEDFRFLPTFVCVLVTIFDLPQGKGKILSKKRIIPKSKREFTIIHAFSRLHSMVEFVFISSNPFKKKKKKFGGKVNFITISARKFPPIHALTERKCWVSICPDEISSNIIKCAPQHSQDNPATPQKFLTTFPERIS